CPAQTTSAPPIAEPGFDLRLFRPAVDSKGLFAVNGTDILGAGDLSFGLVGDAGFGLLRAGRNGAPLVANQFSGYLSANVGIANVLVVGAQIPFHLIAGPGAGTPEVPQSGMLSGYAPSASGLSYQGLGDITVHAKLRWLRAEYFPVGLAVILQ